MITVATTPNPNALKFIVENRWNDFVWECHSEFDAKKSELANAIWAIDGVVYLMVGYDFVSVSKKQDASWDVLQPEIVDAIAQFLEKGVDVFKRADNAHGHDTQPKTESMQAEAAREYTEFEIKVMQVIEEKVQPVLESHGGMVKFISFTSGVVVLDLQGACKGCPSSVYTLKNGIENLLKYYFPEIKEVQSLA